MTACDSNWPNRKLKTVARLITDKAVENAWKVGLENVEGWTGRLISGGGGFEGHGVAFRAGDILFGKLRPYLAKGWVAERSGAAVGDFLVIRPSSEVDSQFLLSCLLSPARIEEIASSVYGAKMPRASWDFVRELEIGLPSLPTQRQAVAFLDRETAEIDAFIADQEELIGLLAERRAATITHAVTKGLDPSVSLKDSGVEWLGEMPVHWHPAPISRSFRVTLGKMLDSAKAAAAGTTLLPYVRAANIRPGRLSFDSVFEMPFRASEAANLDLRLGDLLVVEGGATVGMNAVVQEDMPGWSFQKTVNRVRSLRGSSTKLLSYYIDSARERGVIEMIAAASTFQHLTAEKLERFVMPVPPDSEQAEIAAYLDHETAELDVAIADAREAIALSRERRAALISAAVTGKIDVRGVA